MTKHVRFITCRLLTTLRRPVRRVVHVVSRHSYRLAALDRGLARFSMPLVLAYRCLLSPLKGYRCARSLVGGPSCSEAALAAFSLHPFSFAVAAIEEQFGLCKRAYSTLHSDLFDQAWQHLPSFDHSLDWARSAIESAACCHDEPPPPPPPP